MSPRTFIVAAPLALSFYVVVMAGGQTQNTELCRVEGHVTSGTTPLPGVAIGVRTGDSSRLITSTELDGRFSFNLTPNGTYRLFTDFSGFASVERTITVGASPCNTTVDVQLTLARAERGAAATPPAASTASAAPLRGRGTAPGSQAAAPAGRGGQRFQTLSVQSDGGEPEPQASANADTGEVASLLPPGFSLESAQGDAIAMTGTGGATNVNRGVMNDRLRAIDAGEFDPATGVFAAGFGPPGFGPGGQGGPGGFGGPGGPGGGFPGGGGRGGRGGGFVLGGRGGRGQSPYQGFATYTFGGSALNSPPYQLRPDVPVTQPPFAQNTFGGTFGGPLKIPGIYKDENRRTNFQVNYNGTQSNNLFDQYATVPTLAMRAGDFSATPVQLVDPQTRTPFPGNQIPQSRIDPSAASLLQYIPAPNLSGDTRNYHVSTTAHTTSNAVSLRLIQNLSPTPPPGQGGGRGGGGRGGQGGGGGFGGFGGFGGGGGRGGRGGPASGRTNIVMNVQLQYRENRTESLNVFPNLGAETINRSLTVPVSFNVVKNRTVQNFGINATHSSVATTNGFAGIENAAGDAGILYPVAASTAPLNWGVPNLTFSSFTGVRGASTTGRTDDRITANYMWMRPVGRHRPRVGVDFRYDRAASQINNNARGTYTFTGAYTANGAIGATGADFADFLIGTPNQATLQVGGTTGLRQYGVDAFVQDDWQANSKLTFSLGLRYELATPYVEINNRMANLDANADLTSVAPVLPGGVGPFTGSFPTGLLDSDVNNLGPRLGVAYRVRPSTILRAGYSITYNSGSYASIARELSGQPPFAETDTFTAVSGAPLTIAEALLSPTPATTNNWGVDRDYALGMIQTWNATVSKNFTQDWTVQAGYTGVKGTDLDILRAPALGPGGALIPGAQAFIWESSGGHSIMHSGNVQARRRLAGGITGGVSYTFAHSLDNASSLGAGGAVVAQNDHDLEAEYARSSFERRHQLSGNLFVELPWGPNRRWLKDGGALAAMFGEWSAQFNVTVQSGVPLTARVLGSASDLLRGVNGSLRADYNGQTIPLSNPTVDEFFNTMAFTLPAPGEFGTSSRNMITGPGARQVNALFQRDVRFGGTRSVTVQVNALNLLNTVQWATVDTNVNSPTFGQVLSVRPMRTITLTARMRF